MSLGVLTLSRVHHPETRVLYYIYYYTRVAKENMYASLLVAFRGPGCWNSLPRARFFCTTSTR